MHRIIGLVPNKMLPKTFVAKFLRHLSEPLMDCVGWGSTPSLGIDTTDPVLTVDPANVTLSDLFGECDLSMFDLVTDISGLTTDGDVILGLGVGFDLIDPTMALSGGFDLSDDDGFPPKADGDDGQVTE